MDSPDLLSSPFVAATPARRLQTDRKGRPYEPAIGPRLKILLAVIFMGVAILGASGIYLYGLTVLNWLNQSTGKNYTTFFSLCMILVHTFVGVLFILPFLIFGLIHLASARHRPNRRAVRLGIGLFAAGIVVAITGLALIQLHDRLQLPTGTLGRTIAYGLHVLSPVLAVVLYVLHRRAGPDLKWQWGAAWGVGVAGFLVVMGLMHSFNPHNLTATGSPDGEKYFRPAEVATPDAKFIAADTLMMDEYCLKCHKDIYTDHLHSAHKFSSFNNPPYLFSVRETRKVSLERDGNMRAARWCAGCHDPVPFLSGKFDDPKFDDVKDPTSQAGITCTVCHAMTRVNSTIGNGAYTIEEPQHYPFAKSDNAILQWINNQLVKAKPDFHKQTFLKDFHRTTDFCSTCHKVSLPMELNHYKDFLRGQNHHDTYLLSGVSGHGARSFYYPPEAKTRCAECHMPLGESTDFGSRDFDKSGQRKRHGHDFPGGNTGLPWILSLDPAKKDQADNFRAAAEKQADFLRKNQVRIDLFGLREGGAIDGKLLAPLRPELPKLKPGNSYLVEVVVRTLGLGHPFSQGTVDSNEIWVDFEARSGGKIIAKNGGLEKPDDTGRVDEWSHFINVHMLDRNGNRINRRNPQDIFTPLYDHQIPPGAANALHYRLDVPKDLTGPIDIKVRVRYRKFDFEYLSLVYDGDAKVPKLPIVDMCSDSITLPVEGMANKVAEQSSSIKPPWQRWNDYGIGFLLTATGDPRRLGLKQAEEAFQKLIDMKEPDPRAHGCLNMARCFLLEGKLTHQADGSPGAVEMLNKIRDEKLPSPWWTVSWFEGLVNAQNGYLDEAIENFEKIVDPKNQPRDRKFDFSLDYVVLNELGKTLFQRAQQEIKDPAQREKFLVQAVQTLEKTLKIDQEDLEAHYWLLQCYERLGKEKAEESRDSFRQMKEIPREEMDKLAEVVADKNKTSAERVESARSLVQAVAALSAHKPRPEVARLAIYQKLLVTCRKAFHEENQALVREATADVLASLHRATHALLLPDANAKDRTVALYRAKHKAADAASQAIILYPTDRFKEAEQVSKKP